MERQATARLGDVLRQYRRRLGLSQEDLAERVDPGLSVTTIRNIEHGRTRPYRHTLLNLCLALELTPEEQSTIMQEWRMAAHGAPAAEALAPPSGASEAPAVEDAPALVAASSPPGGTTLPASLTSLVGRERDLVLVREMLLQGDTRLLSLTGSAGVGKTRLSVALATTMSSAFPDGVWFVELAALTDPNLVHSAIANALGLREETGRPVVAQLVDHLRTMVGLLLLDNCEHLIESCATLAAALLRDCPDVRIMVTSREPLGIAGEAIYRVPSLASPDLADPLPPEQLADYASVQLFLQRAKFRLPNFLLTTENSQSVAEICARLDGIPLAIELAAARVGVLPVTGIAGRLNDRFRLLTKGMRTALPRQQTLRAALDWSWDLLEPTEQRLLARLSVFSGGCTLAAAHAVCADAALDEWGILDALDSLADKSLLSMDEQGAATGEVRYCMLETVRQYGQERLAERGEVAAMRDRHLQWYAALAEQTDQALEGAEQTQMLAVLDHDHDNLRTALDWGINVAASDSSPRRETGARLAAALWRFWRARSYLTEGLHWLTLVRARGDLSPALRAKVLLGISYLFYYQGNFPGAVENATSSLELYRALNQKDGIANAQVVLGLIAELQDEYGRARTLVEECLALFRDLGDTRGVSTALYILGQVERDQGHLERSSRYFTESCTLARSLGDSWGLLVALTRHSVTRMEQGAFDEAASLANESLVLSRDVLKDTWSMAWSLCNLAQIAAWQGQTERATALAHESLALSRKINAQWGTAIATGTLALLAHEQGNYADAVGLYQECLIHHRNVSNKWRVAECLEGLARAAVASASSDSASGLAVAAQLFGAAEALRETIEVPRPPIAQPAFSRAAEALRCALGAEATERHWAAGAQLTWQEAVALALAV